jgi:hypothetical protein
MKSFITVFAICSILMSCGTSENRGNINANVSSEGFKADSIFCADWRAKMNQIRKSIPMAPDEVKKLGLPSRFHDYEGDTSSFPLISYSYLKTPLYGKTDFDRFILSTEAEITSANGVAEAERKNVWNYIQSKRYLFIYYPESVTRTGSINSKETISGKTTGVVLVYDMEEMKPKAALIAEAAHDTGKPFDSLTGAKFEKEVADQLRLQLVNNFVKH